MRLREVFRRHLVGKKAPAHADTEKTIAELRDRVQNVLDYVATFQRADFVGAEDRLCTHSWMKGKSLRGGDYVHHVALPNFYFHLTTAYAILRHNGVDVGKNDYMTALPYVA